MAQTLFVPNLAQQIPAFDTDLIREGFIEALEETADDIQEDFDAITATWEVAPLFEFIIDVDGPGDLVLLYGSDDPLWNWLNEGTAGPYLIFPTNQEALAYQKDFSPKTQPGFIGSTFGGKSGDWIVRTVVEHPGIEPRDWETEIFDKHIGALDRRIRQVLLDPSRR